MKHIIRFLLFCTLPLSSLAAQFESGPEPVPLLELYTSEGCSSCPPADNWFSSLSEQNDLWKKYVPVALHVDYWNYLGWPDRFALSEHSERQRLYRRQGYTNGVYTPGVILGGQEWRSWRRGTRPGPVSMDKVGSLILEVKSDIFEASFAPYADKALKPAKLTVALLGIGIESDVRSGENRGRVLKHDFVVLAQRTFDGSQLKWQGRLPSTPLASEAKRLAVAAWVSAAGDLKPLQAVGGWLPSPSLARLAK
ncbi:MAG: DUF1223 domain-containing protein [Pseudomonadota bacterium]